MSNLVHDKTLDFHLTWKVQVDVKVVYETSVSTQEDYSVDVTESSVSLPKTTVLWLHMTIEVQKVRSLGFTPKVIENQVR